jgi:type I restriction enzyme S subunit
MIEGYKESPIGEIPSNWEFKSLEKINNPLTSISYGVVKPGFEDINGVLFIRGGDIKNGQIGNELRTISEIVSNNYSRTLLKGGEILISLVGYPGECAIVPKSLAGANIARQVGVIRPIKDINVSYVQQYLSSPIGKKNLLGNLVGSAQQVINLNMLRKVVIPLPPLPEQQKIAEILSTVDAKIDIIEQQITETQELKKGLMQRLLTKGIGHTEFKDSPLGKIPKSWEVVKLGDVTEQIKDGTHGTHKEIEGGIPLLSAKDIRNGKIYIPDDCRKLSQEDFNSIHKNFKLKDDDVLLTVVGSIGRVAIVDNYNSNYTFQRSVGYIRLNNRNNPYFFVQYFQSDIFVKQLLLRSNASAQAGVYLGELGKILIVSIPLNEQQKITDILSAVDEKLEVLAEKKVNYQELKQGLMQQLLTGKIRVSI